MIKKNKFLFAGLPVIALALGMMVAGCDDGSIDDDSVPSELIGEWGTTGYDTIFTIDKHDLYFGTSSYYNARSSGKKIIVLSGGKEVGTFEYSINSEGKLRITNGTGECERWPMYCGSGLTKYV